MAEDNVIYVGDKKPMNYVLATITQFNEEDSDEVILKARGGAISTAVDAAEITRNRFLTEVDIQDITTKTEELEDEEGGTSNVSAIEITLGMSE
ncbi:RNA-binding protein [candidate division MSBL1 archaeon SCGC-AAA259O05]|uniref:DNA/RNA-binding protein Alba n=1 Tax=candidate division MSBL1 archaeon SCGC-AAA259O05 TaxID=1698271 RepID=A0A133UYP0_9EURY|nr:RNA-binding protein [candidate division MSBL1 archaeon SCGC-AAA259O05]